MTQPRNDANADWQRTIQVVGRGAANTVPDTAVVQLGVRTTAPTAQEASQGAATALNAMLAVVRAHGVADHHIQSGYVNISPEYQHGPEGAKRIGHTASNNVQVRVTPLDQTGAIIDAIIAAGGDLVVINGVQLEASDTQTARTEARRMALLDARAQAEQMAGVLGATVGTVLHIGQSEPLRPGPLRGARMAMKAADVTPIEAGELTTTAEVQVIFALV